jgi:ribose transport system substrate-binding protein
MGISRRRYYSFVLAVFVAGLCGCAPSKIDPASAGVGDRGASSTRYRIMVIPKGESHEFWRSVHAGVLKAGTELDVAVTYKGPKSEGDTADQIAMVENAVPDGYDGICLAPTDAVALRKPVAFALASGIPVVIFDSGLKDMQGIVSYVATDNERGGARAGAYLAELMGGEGGVMLMRYNPGSNSTELREKGFLDEIAKHSGMRVVVQDKHAGPDLDGAIELAENLLSEYGEQTDGIFCPNQTTAAGMLSVLWKQFPEIARRIKFVGFDSGTSISKGLEEKQMNGTILQDPVHMGYTAVRAMVDHLNGKPVPREIPVPEELATSDNLDQSRVRDLLYPDKAQ